MGFQPGNKHGKGRKKGVPNKANRHMREVVEEKLGGKSIPERLLELAMGDAALEGQYLMALLPYCYCKLAPVQVPAPLSPEEQALKDRHMGFLADQLDNDPNPPRSS